MVDREHPAFEYQLDKLSSDVTAFSFPGAVNDEWINFFEATSGKATIQMGGLSEFLKIELPEEPATTTESATTPADQTSSRPFAVYRGNLSDLVGPASSPDLGDDKGQVPLHALEQHRWLYESDYYQELVQKANLDNPTPLTSEGQAIGIRHACSHHAYSWCKHMHSFFASNLMSRTNGQEQIEIKSYTDFKRPNWEVFELLNDGSADSVTASPWLMSQLLPGTDIQFLWGLHPTREQEFRATQAIMPDIEQAVLTLSEGVMINRSWAAAWDNYLFCKEKVDSPEDLTGKRVRSPRTLIANWVQGAGGTPENHPITQVENALRQDLIDCAISGAEAGHDHGWFNESKYLAGPLVNFSFHTNVMNKTKWDSIPVDLQQIIVEEAARSELEELRLASILNLRGLDRNIAEGMEFVPFSLSMRDYLADVAAREHVLPSWIRSVGDPTNPIITETFNKGVGPIVGLRINPDGSVSNR